MLGIEGKQIGLQIAGLGIVFHSPVSASHISEGEDYLRKNYTTAQQVQAHIQKGSIVGFGTGSPGTFFLRFHVGYPDQGLLERCDFKLRLGLECCGGEVCFRDLYELMDWRADCPDTRVIALEDGHYHVTLCSDMPASGILGDNQEIHIYFQRLDVFPRLATEGIPTLCV